MALVLLLARDDFAGVVVEACLTDAGHSVTLAATPTALVSEARHGSPQVIVAEVAEPDGQSEVLCRRLAAVNAPPLLVVVSGTLQGPREAALLRAGADDVVGSPFFPEVFLARLEVLVRRRVLERHGSTARPLIHEGIVVDLVGRRAWVGETELSLTRVEFNILAVLVSSPHRVHTRLELAHAGMLRNADGCLDPHLSRLRRKVRDAGGPRVAIPVHGSGFRLTSLAAKLPA